MCHRSAIPKDHLLAQTQEEEALGTREVLAMAISPRLASRITWQRMRNCIRSLCNVNVARGFKIGKETSLPVTSIKLAEDPIRCLWREASFRLAHPSILCRRNARLPTTNFASALRKQILQHEDSGSDATRHRRLENVPGVHEEQQDCICTGGYEVHMPHIVKVIFCECVPVIILDNYVPPFFEVLDWESFALFVNEEDVLTLRDILLVMPERDFLKMQESVKRVQQHFIWHKNPVKFDLFHMILHSVWYNRTLQHKPR